MGVVVLSRNGSLAKGLADILKSQGAQRRLPKEMYELRKPRKR